MRSAKRIISILMCVSVISSSVVTDCIAVKASAIPVVYTAWDVWQLIMFSLGVTVEVQDSGLVDEACIELKDTFDLWVDSNGFDEITAESVKGAMNQIVEDGKKGIVNISENVWNCLKDWGSNLWNNAVQEGQLELADVCSLVSVSEQNAYYNQFISKLTDVVKGGYRYMLLKNGDRYTMFWTYQNGLNGDWVVERHFPGDVWVIDNVTSFYEADLYIKDLIPTSYFNTRSTNWAHVFDGDAVLCMDNHAVSASDVFFPDLEGLSYDTCLVDYDFKGLLDTGAYDVITQGRTWDGTDVAGDVILTFPQDIPFPDVISGVKVGDIPYTDALEDVGAIPVDTTADKDLVSDIPIADAIDKIKPDTGEDDTEKDTENGGESGGGTVDVPMTFDLTKLFPFCIPFDVIDLISVLSAKPETPRFEVPIKYPTINGTATYIMVVDLSDFDEVAALLRKMECLLFIIGLAFITRANMIRG